MSKYSAHPALQIKMQTSRATFVQQRYPKTWVNVWGNIDHEFRTQRRPLNVASVLRRTARAGDQSPRRARLAGCTGFPGAADRPERGGHRP